MVRRHALEEGQDSSWHLRRATKEILEPGDNGYVEKKNTTDLLTLRMVKEKFKTFAQEFREFSNPMTNQAIEEVAQRYDYGIGHVVWQGQHRFGTKRLRLHPEAEDALNEQLAILAIAEKSVGDAMVKILSFGAYWSRTPGRERFFPLLNRCAVRGILHLFKMYLTTRSLMYASPEDTAPPVVLDVLSEFWEVSERINDKEVEIIASLVPWLPCEWGPGLNPYRKPKRMTRYIQERKKKLLPLKISRDFNLRDIRNIQTTISRDWAQDPRAEKWQAWGTDPRSVLTEPPNISEEEKEIQDPDTLITGT